MQEMVRVADANDPEEGAIGNRSDSDPPLAIPRGNL